MGSNPREMRRQVWIGLGSQAVIEQPRARVRRLTVAPRGHPAVTALVGRPKNPRGVTIHFPGFHIAMGPWEAAKCALLAAITGTTVIMCELPGFSRYGHHLSPRVRRDLYDGDPSSWAQAALAGMVAAGEAAGVEAPDQLDVMAYSTGCSLAVAALPTVQAAFPVRRLTLIEPVSVTSRTLGWLTLQFTWDLIRILNTVPRNLPSSWIRQAGLREFREPRVHYSPADLLALISMLSGDDTGVRLGNLALPATNLARGAKSKLCPAPSFAAVDAGLAARGVPGTTMTISGLGHQMWHALPAIDAIARTLAEDHGNEGTSTLQ